MGNTLLAQPFRLSVYSNTFATVDTVYIEARQAGSFVVIDSFIPKALDRDLFKSIQFNEAAFLRLRNAGQTVYRNFYADGAVAVFYDTLSHKVQVEGSEATDLSDSLFELLSSKAIACIQGISNYNQAVQIPDSNSSFIIFKNKEQATIDSVIWVFEQFILNHPASYVSVDLLDLCKSVMPHHAVYNLLQSLGPLTKKHSFTKWQLVQLQQQISNGEPEPLPFFKIKDARGNVFSAEDLQQGIFLIDFWGTWCGPCIAAMPKLVKLSKKFDGEVQFISYAMQINSSTVAFEAVEKKYGISWKSYFENRKLPTGIVDIFKIEGYPTYILIKDGMILKKSLGARGLPQIESMIERWLEGK